MPISKGHVILFGITALVFAYLLVKQYWRARLTIFPRLITQRTTPRHHQIAPHLRPAYEKALARGISEASKSKIVIVSMVRDVAKSIPNIIEKVERIGKHFKDYIVFIVENDSVDGTRNKLFEWRAANPRVNILGCGLNISNTSGALISGCRIPKTPKTIGHTADRPRIEKMAMLRNIYLDHLRENINPSDYPYSIIWDLDSLSVLYEDGLMHSLGVMSKDPSIAVDCANGIYNWGFFTYFYDTYAYLEKGEVYDPDDRVAHNLRHGALDSTFQRGEDPVEVDSCFSGFAIYRTGELIKSKYDLPEGKLVCEHVALHQRMKGVKKVVDPSMINLILLNE